MAVWTPLDQVGPNTGVSRRQYNAIVSNADLLFITRRWNERRYTESASITATASWQKLLNHRDSSLTLQAPAHVVWEWTVPLQYPSAGVAEFQVYVNGESMSGDIATHRHSGVTAGAVYGYTFATFIPNLAAGTHIIELGFRLGSGTGPLIMNNHITSSTKLVVRI